MYKLLVADDEKWVRRGLKTSIDWPKFNIGEILEARDGEEALEIVKKSMPEIIITDIKMPYLDGLQFIQEVRKLDENIKVIIISGYGEFDYARQAIKLGAVDYILKPIEENTIIQIVTKCINEIEEGRRKNLEENRNRDELKELMPLAQSHYLNMLISKKPDNIDVEDILSKLRKMGMDNINFGRMLVVTILIESSDKDSEDSARENELIKFAIKNIAQDFFRKITDHLLIDGGEKEIVCFLSLREDGTKRERLLNILKAIIKVVGRHLGCNISIGAGIECKAGELSDSYRLSCRALEHRFLMGTGKVLDIYDFTKEKTGVASIIGLNYAIVDNCVKLGEYKKIIELIENVFARLYDNMEHIDPGETRQFLQNLVIRINRTLLSMNPMISEYISNPSEIEDTVGKLATIYQVHRHIVHYLTVVSSCQNSNSNKKRRFIEDALEYIGKHYSEDITMNGVAKTFFLNASYFSKVFNEEVGLTFSEYLTGKRIELARELLKLPYMKVYEVAQRAGYADYRHFSKKFKEYQGVTPLEYRNKIV